MKRFALEANTREKGMKANMIRREGLIPTTLYAHGQDNRELTLDAVEVEKMIREAKEGATVDLTLDGRKYLALIKEIQKDPVTRKVIHIDLQGLEANETMKVSIPVIFRVPEMKNAMVMELLNEIEIEAKAKDLIAHLEIDVPFAEPGTKVHLNDLEIVKEKNLKILTPLDSLVYEITEVGEVQETPQLEPEAPETTEEA